MSDIITFLLLVFAGIVVALMVSDIIWGANAVTYWLASFIA